MSRFYDAMTRAREKQERSKPSPIPTSHRRARPLDTVDPAYEKIVQRMLGFPENQRPKVILVVSAVPNEGTSTVARNLANALGQSQTMRVVLVDANLRTPSQHVAFRIARTNGLSEVVAGTMALSSAIQNGYGPGLSLLTCGRPAKSPAQVLRLPAFRNAIRELRATFDWVIVDGPSVTLHSDAASLAGAADGIILVLQAESTRWEVAEHAKRILDETGVIILGVVLNRRRLHIPDSVYRLL